MTTYLLDTGMLIYLPKQHAELTEQRRRVARRAAMRDRIFTKLPL